MGKKRKQDEGTPSAEPKAKKLKQEPEDTTGNVPYGDMKLLHVFDIIVCCVIHCKALFMLF